MLWQEDDEEFEHIDPLTGESFVTMPVLPRTPAEQRREGGRPALLGEIRRVPAAVNGNSEPRSASTGPVRTISSSVATLNRVPGPSVERQGNPKGRKNSSTPAQRQKRSNRGSLGGKAPFKDRQKIFRRFYEVSFLLFALEPIRASDHIKRNERKRKCRKMGEITDEINDLDKQALLEEFLNSISYVCDTNRAGATVTAAALRDDPQAQQVELVLAGNSGIGSNTYGRLEQVLHRLYIISVHDPDKRKQPEELQQFECRETRELLKDIVEIAFGGTHTRLENYIRQARCNLDSILGNEALKNSLEKKHVKIFKDLQTTLEEYGDFKAQNLESMCNLVRTCHSISRVGMKDIKAYLEDKDRAEHNEVIPNLRHYVGRLGKHLAVSKILVKTALRCPAIFPLKVTKLDPPPKIDDFRLHVPPEDKSIPTEEEYRFTTPERIIGRMNFPDRQPEYLDKLKACDEDLEYLNTQNPAIKPIRAQLEASCKNLKLTVHAELQVLHHFHTNEFQFYTSTRYIGASKPSCILCHRSTFTQKYKGYKLRETHGKLWPSWAPPDAHGKVLPTDIVHMLNELRKDLMDDVYEHLDNRKQRSLRQHKDSGTSVSDRTNTFSGVSIGSDFASSSLVRRLPVGQSGLRKQVSQDPLRGNISDSDEDKFNEALPELLEFQKTPTILPASTASMTPTKPPAGPRFKLQTEEENNPVDKLSAVWLYLALFFMRLFLKTREERVRVKSSTKRKKTSVLGENLMMDSLD